ncbi:hypothetical protein FA13DRAFT_1322386 [Coprinellus micaceus]|uniref:Uncharacterized protein n=1 Tax=Coprinellus micaceus TaxID=71717 RepID=A0A4Y7R519_COPMI|nr:hypothetical protein FA13DRAFT_1322386 [Coprinellus micaceus]
MSSHRYAVIVGVYSHPTMAEPALHRAVAVTLSCRAVRRLDSLGTLFRRPAPMLSDGNNLIFFTRPPSRARNDEQIRSNCPCVLLGLESLSVQATINERRALMPLSHSWVRPVRR